METKTRNLRMTRGDSSRIGLSIIGMDTAPDGIVFSVKRFYSSKEYLIQKSLGDGIYAVIKITWFDGTLQGNTSYPNQLQDISVDTQKPSTASDANNIAFTIPEGAVKCAAFINCGQSFTYDTDIDAVAEGFSMSWKFD